ncbi:MAG: M18 family aminopeptidase [Treponema sp. CETP13]|nr:MAG: M18 family aminopeptidase [Treponema sp. CETP13]
MDTQQSNNDFSITNYLESSITAWHSIQALKSLFINRGFIELNEEKSWKLLPGKSYFVIRNHRSMAAFTVGKKSLPSYKIIATHTDSPHLRIKTDSFTTDSTHKNTLKKVRTSVYGGAILNTWLDRPLASAGVVYIKDKKTNKPKQLLFDSEKPIGIIPNLPIHLNREINKKGEVKPQQQLQFIFDIQGTLEEYIAKKLKIQKDLILSIELELYLPNKPQLTNSDKPLLFSPRIDNQIHCITTAKALINSAHNLTETTQVAIFFDSEETGSLSMGGAKSSFIEHLLERISISQTQSRENQLRARAKSLILSADVAHAWNSNYPEKFDPSYKCVLNEGPVIKIDENNRYATTPETEALLRLLATKNGIPLQKFIIHSDLPCGSTVGPMLSSQSSIPCIDIGVPIWAMHSICETAGMSDVKNIQSLFEGFYTDSEL